MVTLVGEPMINGNVKTKMSKCTIDLNKLYLYKPSKNAIK